MEQKLIDFYGAPTSNDTALCGLLSKEQALGFLLSDAAETAGEIKQVRPPPDPDRPGHLVVLRNMSTGAEHMHPSPLQSLDSWHMHFLDCGLFSGIDFSQDKGGGFPKLLAPKPDVDAFTSMEFIKQGTRFRVRVVVAPVCSDWVYPNIVGVHAESPPLPVFHDDFEKRFKSSMERTGALKTFAQAALCAYHAQMTVQGKGIAAGGSGGAAGLADRFAYMQLQHGGDVGALASDRYAPLHTEGELRLGTVETSAGAAVIPAVLAKLHFLYLTLTGPVPFMIYPVSKFSYMVYIFDIGGWKVLMCVNMRASADAMKGFFERAGKSQVMPSPVRALRPTMPHSAIVNAANSSLKKVKAKYLRHYGSPLTATTPMTPAMMRAKDPGEYFIYMQFQGLMTVISGMLARDKTILSMERLQTGRAAVRALLSPWSAQPSEEEKVDFSACKLYMCAGLAAHLWDFYAVLVPGASKDNFKSKIHTIPPDLKQKNFLGLHNQRTVNAVWKSWKDCHPSQWWRSMCSIYNIQPLDLAHVIMEQKGRLDPFFPERVFGDQSEMTLVNRDMLDNLCSSCPAIFEAREIYEKMVVDTLTDEFMTNISNHPDRAKMQRDFVATGMGFAILYGTHVHAQAMRPEGIPEVFQ